MDLGYITEYNLAIRPVYRSIELSFSIKRMDIEVLTTIYYITLEKGLECSANSTTDYLQGYALYNRYTIINRLVSAGYLENTGRKGHNRRFYLSLTDKGRELIDCLKNGFARQIKAFRENKALKKNKINSRIKKRAEAGGSAPLLCNGGGE